MTAGLAMRTGLPGTLRADGYDLPPDLSYDEWRNVLGLAEHIHAASPWWLGDALVYGERRFPDRHSQALPVAEDDPDGARQSRMKAAAWVSSAFPPVTRVTGLSWSHHRAVAELPDPDRKTLLEAARREKWATRELIERANKRKDALRGRVADASPDEPELAWSPDISELTPEARALLELYAPAGRNRSVYVAGFLRALLCAELREWFTEWRGP